MRSVPRLVVIVVMVAACSSGGSKRKRATSLADLVVRTKTAVKIEADHQQFELAALPIASLIGLPVSGTIEIDGAVDIPLDARGKRADLLATGTLAVRCVDRCRIGDDVARLMTGDPSDPFTRDGFAFSHLDLEDLDVEITFADRHARLTRWRWSSPDLDVRLAGDVTLAPHVGDSMLDLCVRFRTTDALLARDRDMHALFSLLGATHDDDGFSTITVRGTLSHPRAMARLCDI